MALENLSSFKYGFEFTETNNVLELQDENGVHTINFPTGDSCVSDLALFMSKILSAFNSDLEDYIFSIDPANCTLKIERNSGMPFDILTNSGSSAANGVYDEFGFDTSADLLGQTMYQGLKSIGKNFIPQFPLQDFIPCENNRSLRNATKTESATGECCEILHCGFDEIFSFEIKAQTNIAQTCRGFRNANGEDELRDFLDWAICGKCIEFAPDCDEPEKRYKIKLERTRTSRDGTGYRLTEMIRTLGCGYYRTGTLEFRCLEKPEST